MALLLGWILCLVAATLLVPGTLAATAACVAIVIAGLLLIAASTRERGTEGERGLALLFSCLFVATFALVCLGTFWAGEGLGYRAVFALVGLPIAFPGCALVSLSLLPRQRPASLTAPASSEAPLVSMILATRNEPFEVVKMTLESVMALDYPAERMELVVTDNSDESHPDLKRLRDYLETIPAKRAVRLLHRDGKEGAKARNLDIALKETRGEFILLVDADSTLARDSVSRAVAHMARSPRTGYVQFRMSTSNWKRNAFTFCAPYMTDVLIRGVEEIRSVLGFAFNGGHNVLWRRRTLDDVAPFEQYLGGVLCQTEDYCASMRTALAGWRGEMLPIDAWEWAPFDTSSYLKQWYRWGYGAQQGMLHYGGDVVRSRKMTYGGKVALLLAFAHFLSPVFTIVGTIWAGIATVLGGRSPVGVGAVGFALATGSLGMLVLYVRSERSHDGAGAVKRVGAMIYAAVVLFGLTTWATMLSTFANLGRKEMAWVVTAKK